MLRSATPLSCCTALQKVGLGKFLMQLAELIAWRNGMTQVMLTVFHANLAGIAFYSKLGYKESVDSPGSDSDAGCGRVGSCMLVRHDERCRGCVDLAFCFTRTSCLIPSSGTPALCLPMAPKECALVHIRFMQASAASFIAFISFFSVQIRNPA